MGNLTPTVISDLGRYLDRHTECSEDVAREVIRAASAGQAVDLPVAIDFAGEVLRGQLVTILGVGSVGLSPAASAPATSTPAPKAEPATSLSVESRRAIFRAAAGPRLEAFADALAATEVSDEQALRTIEAARKNLPPETAMAAFGFPAGYTTVEERARGLPEMGPSAPPMSKAEAAAEGWKAAFSKAERRGGAA